MEEISKMTIDEAIKFMLWLRKNRPWYINSYHDISNKQWEEIMKKDFKEYFESQ